MNVARSALNNFLKICGNVDINLYEEITRFMKGVFQSSPALPRYAETWDVNDLKSFNSQYYFVSNHLSVVYAVFTYISSEMSNSELN